MRLFIMSAACAAIGAPAVAQTSHCATLPEKARVEVRGPDTLVPARLTPGGHACPRGSTLEKVGTTSRCRQPGPARTEEREPRRDCYAALPLGPVKGLSGLLRPTLQCPGSPTLDSIVAVRGANAGWQDISLTAPPAAAITITQLKAAGPSTPPAQNPATQDCFPDSCRLVRLTTRAGTPARVDLTLATPGNAASTSFSLTSEASCPSR